MMESPETRVAAAIAWCREKKDAGEGIEASVNPGAPDLVYAVSGLISAEIGIGLFEPATSAEDAEFWDYLILRLSAYLKEK